MNKVELLGLLSAIIALAIGSLHAATQSIFAVLGRTPEDPGWGMTLTLFLSLLVSTLALAIGMLTTKESALSSIAIALSAAISGAWLGVYYGGTIGSETPQLAIAIAIIGLLFITKIGWHRTPKLTLMAILVCGIISAYSLSFLCSAAATAFLSTNHLLWGSIWASFCLTAIAITIFFLNLLSREIANYRAVLNKRAK